MYIRLLYKIWNKQSTRKQNSRFLSVQFCDSGDKPLLHIKARLKSAIKIAHLLCTCFLLDV